MVLAPMEQATQQEVIWLGASIWPRLDETQRQQLKRIMKNALRALPDQVADAAIAYGLVEEIRPLLENEGQHRLLEQRLRAFGQGG